MKTQLFTFTLGLLLLAVQGLYLAHVTRLDAQALHWVKQGLVANFD